MYIISVLAYNNTTVYVGMTSFLFSSLVLYTTIHIMSTKTYLLTILNIPQPLQCKSKGLFNILKAHYSLGTAFLVGRLK